MLRFKDLHLALKQLDSKYAELLSRRNVLKSRQYMLRLALANSINIKL